MKFEQKVNVNHIYIEMELEKLLLVENKYGKKNINENKIIYFFAFHKEN